MAASTITRGTFVDGTTPWNSSNISSLIYDRIDQMFGGVGGYATLELGGALKINGALTQLSNDGGALGTSSLGWSDLFLASGGVINFANGDVTITHSTNTLTWAGASSGYIFNDGNVGIGVTPKTFTSGRAVELGAAGNIAWGNGGGDMFVASNLYYNADFKYAATNAIAAMRLQDGVVKFLTAPSGTVDTTATMTERFRVLNVGNIAIGATAKFYLDGVAGTGDTYIYEVSANNMQFYTGGTLGLQIDNVQNVIMKATGRLYLDGGGDTYIYEESGNQITFVTGGTGRLFIDTATVGPRTDNNISSGSNVLRWSVVYAANGTIQTSDRTLKRDISTDTLGLDFVQKLRPVSFTMRDEADGARRHGLIAQEVIEAADGQSLLGILTGEKDGEYGLNYAGFVPALIAAIQQQQNKIAALEARIH